MKVVKKRIKKIYFLKVSIKIMVLISIFYGIFVFINQRIQINSKLNELSTLNNQLESQKIKNLELKKITQSSNKENEQYFIQIARDLNLSKQNEKIFINTSGK